MADTNLLIPKLNIKSHNSASISKLYTMLQDPSFTQLGMGLKEISVRLGYLWNNLLECLSYCFTVSSELSDTEGCGYVQSIACQYCVWGRIPPYTKLDLRGIFSFIDLGWVMNVDNTVGECVSEDQ